MRIKDIGQQIPELLEQIIEVLVNSQPKTSTGTNRKLEQKKNENGPNTL